MVTVVSKTGKQAFKNVQVTVLDQSAPKPLDVQIQVSKQGYIQVNDTVTVSCTSLDNATMTLIVEVNGEIKTQDYLSVLNTTIPGRFVFRSNSFLENQQIRFICVGTLGTQT